MHRPKRLNITYNRKIRKQEEERQRENKVREIEGNTKRENIEWINIQKWKNTGIEKDRETEKQTNIKIIIESKNTQKEREWKRHRESVIESSLQR